MVQVAPHVVIESSRARNFAFRFNLSSRLVLFLPLPSIRSTDLTLILFFSHCYCEPPFNLANSLFLPLLNSSKPIFLSLSLDLDGFTFAYYARYVEPERVRAAEWRRIGGQSVRTRWIGKWSEGIDQQSREGKGSQSVSSLLLALGPL